MVDDISEHIPEAVHEIKAQKSGYLSEVYEDFLQSVAEKNHAEIYLVPRLGTYLSRGDVLAYVTQHSAAIEKGLHRGLMIESNRNFKQDYTYGLTVLTEIASRALSPAVNDPQTAVLVIDRLSSILTYASPKNLKEYVPKNDRVYIERKPLERLFIDTFETIARDGEGCCEVYVAMRRALRSIYHTSNEEGREACLKTDQHIMIRARRSFDLDLELDQIEEIDIKTLGHRKSALERVKQA